MSRLTSYPPFRLTLALAGGIVLADCFLSGGILWLGCAAFALFAFMACLYRLRRYHLRHLFGLCSTLAFMMLGGALLLWHRAEIRFDWPKGDVLYIGQLQDVPQQRTKTCLATVRVTNMRTDSLHGWTAVNRDILLYYMPDTVSPPLKCGDRVCFYGRVSRPSSDAELTGFDYARYLESHGIGGTAVAFGGRWKLIRHDDAFSLRRSALLFREKVLAKYRSWGMKDDVLAVVMALTVGDKSELTPELKATFSAAGTSHVLALSGLHIGILSLILSWLLYPLRWVRGGRWLISMCVVFFLWGFAFMSGLSPSVVRAVTMFSLYLVSSVVSDSRYSGFYALSLTAFVMLLYQPMYLFDISFQLSFVAVLSILLLSPMVERLYVPKNAVVRYVWKAIVVSLSAQVGTTPLILHYFGAFPTYFLLSNLFITPMAVSVLSLALLALCFPWSFLVRLLSLSVSAMNGLMAWVCGLFGSQITSVYFSGWQSAVLFAALLCLYLFFARKSRRGLIGALLCLNLLAVSFMVEYSRPPEEILHFSRGEVRVKTGRQVSLLNASQPFHRVKDYDVAIVSDGRWKNKQSSSRLVIHYAYLCRGYRGNAEDLHRLFDIRCLLLDASLNETYKAKLKRECDEHGIKYIDLSEKGAYSVRL